ncbi:MAG: hypothetical protein A2038_10535 [Deltaproteobacteria bacterium GWA2_57_13]|nr:MAG: hypothetical protein A2038_10535 [Deltaproteobacteria bacterium GWA2_57_13]OGQ81004.1 MAG: hypothetical protein A3G40_15925 [Deltaproteobacteria bacterium RIFCSPLOWO2_12_FULL_57_22]
MKCPSCGKDMRATRKDYRYEESGLENVMLKDITVHECKCGETLPEIPSVKRLHGQIADDLINKQGPLTGEEFRFLRKGMRTSAKELAQLLGVTTVTLSRWENNKEKVGPQSDRLLRYIYLTRSKGLVASQVAKRLEGIMVGIVDRKPPKAVPIFIRPAA